MSRDWLIERWQRALAVVVVVVGIVLLVAGWAGVSDSGLTTQQIPYLASGAVGGLFALGVAATLWLSADLRDEFVKLDEIYRWLQGEDEADLPVSNGETTSPEEVETDLEPAYTTATPRRRPLRARSPATTSEP